MDENTDKQQKRDYQGRFDKGNKVGIDSSEKARELQLLSAKARVENRKKQIRLSLLHCYCELKDFDDFTTLITLEIQKALWGNLMSIINIYDELGIWECANCGFDKLRNSKIRRKVSQSMVRTINGFNMALMVLGIHDEEEMSFQIGQVLINKATDITKPFDVVEAARIIRILLSPCQNCGS